MQLPFLYLASQVSERFYDFGQLHLHCSRPLPPSLGALPNMASNRQRTLVRDEEPSEKMTSVIMDSVHGASEPTTIPDYLDPFSHCNGTNSSANCSDFMDPNCEPCGFCHYETHTVYVMGYLATSVIVFGLVANALNARIFTHRFMRNSLLNWYYAALSMSDLCVLSISFFRDCLPRLSDYARHYGVYSLMSVLTPATQTVGCCAQTCSVFLTVAMSAHRFVGVCFPFKANRICSKTNTRIFLGSVIVFAVFFNIPRAFEVQTMVFECDVDNITEPAPTAFRQNQYYMNYYLGWAYTFVMYVVPFTLLISLNLKVLLAIRTTSNLHRRMSVRDTNANKRREFSKEVSET